MDKAGLKMPDVPTWDFIARSRREDDGSENGNLWHLPSRQGRLGREHGLPDGHRQFVRRALVRREVAADSSTRRSGRRRLTFYVDLMKVAGPPGASSNGFTENLTLFNSGKCGIWIDATSAGSFVTGKDSQSPTRSASRWRPTTVWARTRQLAVVVVARHSHSLEENRGCGEVHQLGDGQGLSRSRRLEGRLVQRTAGHAHFSLQEPGIPESRILRGQDAEIDGQRGIRSTRLSSRFLTSAFSSWRFLNSRASPPMSVRIFRRLWREA